MSKPTLIDRLHALANKCQLKFCPDEAVLVRYAIERIKAGEKLQPKDGWCNCVTEWTTHFGAGPTEVLTRAGTCDVCAYRAIVRYQEDKLP